MKTNDTTPVIQSPNYWDCECENDYIHSKIETVCEKCGADQTEQPDSRVDEVDRMLAGQVAQSNKLIAEFMHSKGDEGGYWWYKGNPTDNSNSLMYTETSAKFHTSWDWLIPVIKKITTIKPEIETKGRDLYYEVGRCLQNLKIEATYKAVIEFINWYNANNCTRKDKVLKEIFDNDPTSILNGPVDEINHIALRSDFENGNTFDTCLRSEGKTCNEPETWAIVCETSDEREVCRYLYDSKHEYLQDIAILNITD